MILILCRYINTNLMCFGINTEKNLNIGNINIRLFERFTLKVNSNVSPLQSKLTKYYTN